jgi:hypothetical protein
MGCRADWIQFSPDRMKWRSLQTSNELSVSVKGRGNYLLAESILVASLTKDSIQSS